MGNDEELHKLLQHVTIACGGVLPKIHPQLINSRKGGKSANNSSSSPKKVYTQKSGQTIPPHIKLPPKKAIKFTPKKAPAQKALSKALQPKVSQLKVPQVSK